MTKNIILIICIFLLFAYHFYLEHGFLKYFQETFQKACDRFYSRIDDIYYINLEHRNDRKTDFLSNFSNEDVQQKIKRVNAIYTKEDGAIGCLKSHILALENAIENSKRGDEIFLICEDDLYIENIFYCNKMLDWAMNHLPQWDVIMIAHNTHASVPTPYKTKNGEEIIQVLHSATGSGYLMHASYAPKLLKIYKRDITEYEKTGVFKREYCNDVSWKELQEKDKWYAFRPTTGIQRRSYSDIQKGVVEYGV